MEFLGKTINGKYLLEEIISENPLWTRYRGRDTFAGGAVDAFVIASAVMSRRPGDVIRFKNVAAKMAEIHHPSILRVIEAGEFFDRAYVITETVEGKSLAEYLAKESGSSFSLEKKVYIVKCVAEALEQAHEKGIVHRAISPRFIFMAGERIVLGGFGFAYILEYPDDFPESELESLLGHLPPEQRGIIRRSVDERSDLYALGVLAYRLVSGALPCGRKDNFSVMPFQELPVPLRKAHPDIPEVLEKIVFRLLAKEPADRYRSAAGLAHDLEMCLQGNDDFIIGQKDGPMRVEYRATLAGRKSEMHRLEELFTLVLQGGGTSVAIVGPAGCGKSRLVEEFKEAVQFRGALFLEAKCHHETVNTPYEALYGLFNSMIELHGSGDETVASGIEELFLKETAECREFIVRLHPGFRRILKSAPGEKKSLPSESSLHHHIIIARFLRSLEKLGGALVLFIDDVQWMDAGSLEAVCALSGMLEGARVLLMLTSRGEDEFSGHGCKAGKGIEVSEVIRLGMLDAVSLRALVAGMLSEKEENVADLAGFVYAKSGGNPLFAVTILKNLIESGAVAHDGTAWKYTAKAEMMDIPLSLVDLVAESARLLGDREREVIECAAVAGKATDLALLFRVADVPEEQIVAAIDTARWLHILKEAVPGSDAIQFIHDRIMEIFLERIPPEKKKALHLKIARALNAQEYDREKILFDLAHHYSESGDWEQAVRYLYPAALLAQENHAYRDAARYFHKTIAALDELREADEGQMVECKLGLAAVDVIIGEYEEAIALLDEVLPVLERNDLRARAHLVLCQAHYRKADWKRCEAHAAAGLALLGDFVPTAKFRTILSLIRESAVHLLHVALPVLFVKTKLSTSAKQYQRIIEFYEPLGMSYALNEPIKLVRSNIHALNIAERRIGPSTELAMSYYAVGALYMSVPLFSMAGKYLESARRMNESLGSRWGLAKTLELFGYFHEWQAQYGKAIEYFEKAKQIFHELGDMKEFAMVLNGIEHCEYYSGDYDRALATNTEYYELVKRLGDEYSLGAALIYFSQYHREKGNIGEAMRCAEEARELSLRRGIWFNYCSALNELGCNAIEAGEFSQAIQFLEEAKKLHEKNTFLKQYIVPLYANLARAHLDGFLLRHGSAAEKERREAEKKIFRSCREAVSKTGRWPTHHAGALLELARAMSVFGKDGQAREHFEKARRHAGNCRRVFEELRAIVEFGNHLLRRGDGAGARARFEEAYRLSVEIGAGLYTERLSKLLGIDEREEKTPFERHLGKERHLLLAETAQRVAMLTEESELLKRSLEAVMDFTGVRHGCLLKCNPGENAFEAAAVSGMDAVQVQSLQEEVSNKTQIENDAFVIRVGDNHYMVFPVSGNEGAVGMCIIENPFQAEGFSRKDTVAVMSFMENTGKALYRLRQNQKMDSSRDAVSYATEQKVQKAIEYIRKNYTSDISREGLAASLDINPDHLGKAFKSITGEKIGDYINRLRVEDAAKRLAESKEKIIEIAYAVGFESLSTFNRAFGKIMGISPQEYRKTKGVVE